jgi:hypothetical protein
VTGLEIAAVLLAGVAAGTINTVVGSGTLITFPTLLALGVPPVTANVSNTVGLVPGSLSGAVGYRRELAGQRSRLLRLASASVLGGITGAVLLLVLPSSAWCSARRSGGRWPHGTPPAGVCPTTALPGCGRPSRAPASTAATSVLPRGCC